MSGREGRSSTLEVEMRPCKVSVEECRFAMTTVILTS